MERLTIYDSVRNCYVMRPDARQGEHIQRLGMYEDRAEAKEVVYKPIDVGYTIKEAVCKVCGESFEECLGVYPFCPHCGQRLKWGE